MKLPASSRLAVLAAFALGMIPLTSNAQVIFGPDTNMTTTNWTYGQTSISSNVNIDVAPALSNVTDPDLGAALRVSTQVDFSSTNNKNIAGTIFNSSWTYNPSVSGAITSFNFTGDFTASFPIAVRPVVIQGGVTYWTVNDPVSQVVAASGVTGISYAGLIESNFLEFPAGTDNPDFSSSGSVITFGYAFRYGSAAAFNNRVLELNADSVAFTVIPEPSSAVLLIGALAGFLALRRRRA